MAYDGVSGLRAAFEINAPKEAANNDTAPGAPAVALVREYRGAAARLGARTEDREQLPRVIRVTGPINNEMADTLNDVLRTLDKAQPGAPIELRINSPGGEVMAGLRIFDTMKSLHSPIATVCDGQCASMAAVLLAAGTPGMRSATPNSIIMIHELSAQLPGGKYSNLKSWQKYADILEDKLVTILSDYTGHSKEELAEIMRDDTFYSSDDALKLNLIDRVQTPLQMPPPKQVAKAAEAPPPGPRLVQAAA